MSQALKCPNCSKMLRPKTPLPAGKKVKCCSCLFVFQVGEPAEDGDAQVTFKQTQRQRDGNTYDVFSALTRRSAIGFLRQHEVKEERRYAIVETPEGNVGRDFIVIFDERTQEVIELGERKPLPSLSKSTSHCCRCGYPIIPFINHRDAYGSGAGGVTEYTVLTEMKTKGAGFSCSKCHALCCAICVPTIEKMSCPLCRGMLQPYRE